jgi:circadian clock protein KaiC
MTSTGPVTDVGESLSHANISTSVDTIIMLRYAELFGTIQRGIIILKMRGTDHEHYIRKFTIDDAGIHIQEPFPNISGVLSGSLSYATGDEVKEISQAARNRSDDLNDEE